MSEESPYLPPQSSLNLAQQGLKVVPAAKGLRFLNLFLDYFCFTLFGVICGVAAALIFGEEVLAQLDNLPDIVIGAPIVLTYYLLMEGTTGRTIGKLITGTKVVNKNGKDATFAQIMGRSLCRFIPFEAISFLLGEGRGWHDTIPDTYVVKCR